MHIEKGMVTQIVGEYVEVQSTPSSPCSKCGAKDSCLASTDGKMKSIMILNTLLAKKNDIVSFKIEEKGVIISSLLLYGLPVFLLLVGLVIGSKNNKLIGVDKDGAAAIGAIIGILFALVIIKIITKFFNKKNIFAPTLISIDNNFYK